MEIDMKKNPGAILVPVPGGGALKATRAIDPRNPGIYVVYVSPDGTEKSSCLFEYTDAEGILNLMAWDYDAPEDDPRLIHAMSPRLDRPKTNEKKG